MVSKSKQLTTFILIGALCISAISLTGCKKESEPTEPTVTTNNEPPAATTKDEPVVTTDDEILEQKMCPVMNAPINKELYTEYKGKKVYFCCSGCKEIFEKDPEKYLSKLPQFK
jgi:YHS domain-containing protein